MSTIKTNAILDASGGNTTTINGTTPTAYNTMGKNRIINGAMEIDQRNAGSSVTATTSTVYTVDRWGIYGQQASKFTAQQNAGSVTPPAGFKNYLGITSSSAYSVLAGDNFKIVQPIEGLNCADLGFGTSDAKTLTLSFWVRSSLTGTFGGSFTNSSYNRSYPFTYSISSANTWEQKSITFTADTSGTWLTTNGIGVNVIFSMGMGTDQSGTAGSWAAGNYQSVTGATSVVGTSGATFYITGVQLEVGSVATEFERRPYGTELALCQRYCVVISGAGTTASSSPVASGYCVGTTNFYVPYVFKVTPRTPPTGISVTNPTSFTCAFGAASNPSAINFTGGSFEGCFMQAVITGGTGGYGGVMYMNNTNAKIEITGMEL